ncbi:MAG: helix-turn-helix transcriptional regulator [Ruminococcaceae bacterium]|nr:helix-turn-helix transcriptional regulator [Oscillospiraceae bacterium]
MTIGEKLKKLRQIRGLTQNDLAGENTSRNMICQIERGSGNPSLQTLKHLSKVLAVDPGYFLTEEDNLNQYLISACLPQIQNALKECRYRDCIRLCDSFTEEKNNEIMCILALCYCHCGEENYETGYLESAKSDFYLARQYAESSQYSMHIKPRIEFFITALEDPSQIINNHRNRLPESFRHVYETVLYRQILDLISLGNIENAAIVYDSLSLESTHYRRHINARLSIARCNYDRAKNLLQEIIRDRDKGNIHVPFLIQIYKDMELCCKSTQDYEGAYRCAKQLIAFTESSHH